MKILRQRITGLAVLLIAAMGLAWAIPGYHVNDEASAEHSVQQYANDAFKFKAVIYQAYLDKDVWRLALAAHRYLQQKPDDAQRECSFAEAYWYAQPQSVTEQVPPSAAKQLARLYQEAVRDTEDAAKKLPNSVAAHLNYGQYLMENVMGSEKVPLMLHEFQKAVALKPNLGEAHYCLAEGYGSSGKQDAETVDRIIAEAKTAVTLDPRLANSYFLIACVYDWPSHRDLRSSQVYLAKYLRARPSQASRPDVVALQKDLNKRLAAD